MSGLSLAAGPVEQKGRPDDGTNKGSRKKSTASRAGMEDVEEGGLVRGLMGSLRTIELQLVAFIVVFSASGLVPVLDLLFPLFVTAYTLTIARFVFPARPTDNREVFHGSRMFQLYVALGTVLGLFLPLAYVLGGFARGDQAAVRAATPHLFLLSVQILSENIISSLALFSPPVRVILTLIYTARRLFALYAWVVLVFAAAPTAPSPPPRPPHDHLPPPHLHHDFPPHEEFPGHPPHLDHHRNTVKDVMWIGFGRWLAIANLIYFSINTFCFLIPRFLPRAFERYLIAKKADSPSGDNQPSNAQQQAGMEATHTPFQGKTKESSPLKQTKENNRKELEEKKSA